MVERGRAAPKIENNGKEVKKLRSNRKGRKVLPIVNFPLKQNNQKLGLHHLNLFTNKTP